MKILVSAGGTGGHIYPAISIIDEFKKQEKDLEIIFVGTTNRMEKDIIPTLNIKYVPIEIYGLTKDIIHDIKDIILIRKDIKKMINLMNEYKPDIVLAIGGYVTYPVIKAAYKLHIPIFLHEQNAIPGKVNKLTAKYADLIGVSFASSIKYFKNKNTFVSGNPTSDRAIKANSVTKSSLGLEDNKRLVTFVAGSLGSSTINNVAKEFLKNMDNKDYQVLYITGKSMYDEFIKDKYPNNVKIMPYVDNLPGLLKNTDILVTRAGASTIAEIKALNVVSIFIPSPYVANNHQYYNAKELVDNNLALMIEEKKLNANILEEEINNLFKNTELYNKIKNNLRLEEINSSSKLIYDKIKELLDDK